MRAHRPGSVGLLEIDDGKMLLRLRMHARSQKANACVQQRNVDADQRRRLVQTRSSAAANLRVHYCRHWASSTAIMQTAT